VVPIFQGEKLWGLLIAHHCRSQRNWNYSEIESLKQISVQLAIAIQQSILFEQAKTEIADRKLAETALQKAVVAADKANRAKSEFLANMSHELRTPLNAILGFSQVMVRDSSLNNQHQQHLEIINRAGEHLLSLINDILEMSKIEAGRSQLNESSFNLIRLLDSLEGMFRLKARSKKLQLSFEVVDSLPHFVNGDEGKLRQVLINIVGNAIKFTETGSVTLRVKQKIEESLTIETAARETKNPVSLRLQFEIEDTGPGIATEEMDKLFQPFEQTKTGYKSAEGTGLGLPISLKFVQMMGGDIAVCSTPDVGSTFSFQIQLNLADPTEIKLLKPHKKVIGLAPNQPEYRILVVDDRADNCLVIIRLLSPLGILVREARNGQEAIAIWEEWQPHLIWMDMQMPVMNGYQATREIKAHPLGKQTTIVALTASVFEEERQTILAAGCDDFMCKPFEAKILFAKMEELLGVRYIYEEPVEAKLENESEISGVTSNQSVVESQLYQMPVEWIEKLYDAAHECCDDKIILLIEEIPTEFAIAAKFLTDLAHDFLFDDIMELGKSVITARQC
jgi:signal transduction histidine kinase/CheY-like chemotaxis protein